MQCTSKENVYIQEQIKTFSHLGHVITDSDSSEKEIKQIKEMALNKFINFKRLLTSSEMKRFVE